MIQIIIKTQQRKIHQIKFKNKSLLINIQVLKRLMLIKKMLIIKANIPSRNNNIKK